MLPEMVYFLFCLRFLLEKLKKRCEPVALLAGTTQVSGTFRGSSQSCGQVVVPQINASSRRLSASLFHSSASTDLWRSTGKKNYRLRKVLNFSC